MKKTSMFSVLTAIMLIFFCAGCTPPGEEILENQGGNGGLTGTTQSRAVSSPGIYEIQLTTLPSYAYNPSVVWNGTEYGVVWNDRRSGFTDIYFA